MNENASKSWEKGRICQIKHSSTIVKLYCSNMMPKKIFIFTTLFHSQLREKLIVYEFKWTQQIRNNCKVSVVMKVFVSILLTFQGTTEPKRHFQRVQYRKMPDAV